MENELDRSSLKFKRKRDQFKFRIQSLIEFPHEIKKNFTLSLLEDELAIPNILVNKTDVENEDENNDNEINVIDEKKILTEEIGELINEIELFNRENRKKKMRIVMESLCENLNEELIDEEELLEYYLFGNKISNVENEYLNKERNKYANNPNLCAYTNRLLLEDDEQLNNI